MSKFLEKVADVLELLDAKEASTVNLKVEAEGQKPEALGEPAQKMASNNSKPNSVQEAWAAFGENITR